MVATISINGQNGSRSDIAFGATINLNDAGGGSSWLWELLSAPPGSTASFSATNIQNPTLGPLDAYGSFRIRVTENGTSTDIAIAAVRTERMNIRIPATGEEDEFDESGNTDGWSPAMHNALITIDSYGFSTLAELNALVSDATLDDSSDSRPPSGAAGGQLGGTYPNPDVRGIRETSGPTQLTIGSITDGQVLIRSGATITSQAAFPGNTLDQAYDEGGAGAGRSITADSGPVEIDASGNMALELDGYISLAEISDPTNIANSGFLYTKDNSGITELFYMDDAGTITQITADGYLDTFDSLIGVGLFEQTSNPAPAVDKGFLYTKDISGTTGLFYMDSAGSLSRLDGYGGGNTLDQAYDEGGAGAGRTITADSGAVEIDASGGEALNLDGYISLAEISDPTGLLNTGLLYSKDVGGITELFYVDSDNNAVQITSDGIVAIDGYTVLERFDELNPATTNGTETSLSLNYTPMEQTDMPSGRALDVFQNGARMRYTAVLGVDKTEWTYNSGLNRVEFVASGVAGTWYAARYKTNPEFVTNSLNQSYNAGRVITASSGPVEIDASGDSALELDGYITLNEISEPTSLLNAGLVYSKDVDGYSEFFYMDDYGLSTQITNKGSAVGGGGASTLDQAYDGDGYGLGRTIIVDSGPVEMNASGDAALELDGYLLLNEITDPANISDKGFLYAKNDDAYGTSELFYMDDYGQITQITQDGYLATYNSLRGVRLLDGESLASQSGSLSLFSKRTNGISELFTRDSSGYETQITSGGQINLTVSANSGFANNVIEYVPDGYEDLDSTSFADLADGYFNALVAGNYIFNFNVQVYQSGGTFQKTNFRIVVDKNDYNGFTEQVVEPSDNGAWNIYSATSGEHYSGNFVAPLTYLNTGEHKITIEYSRASGNSAQISSSDYVNLTAINLSGSGLGGAISSQNSLSANKNFTSVDTWETISELNVNFTTSENERVLLVYSGSVFTTGLVSTYTSFAVDGYRYQDGVREGLSNAKDISKSYVTPPLSRGSHTANLQVKQDGAGTLTVDAYGTLQVLQFRGGLVPIQKEGTSILEVPTAFNFIGDGVTIVDNYGVAEIYIGTIDYFRLEQQTSNPTTDPDGYDGYVYAKLTDGYSEMFYMDNYGLATQITQNGTIIKHEIAGVEHTSSTLEELNDLISNATLVDESAFDAYAEKALLDAYATNSDLELKADLSLLDEYAYLSLLDAYATNSDLELKADKSLLDEYAYLSLLDAYATNSDLELKADLSLLDAYATNSDLELKADKSLLDAYAYLSLLDAYATNNDLELKADLSLLDAYATNSDLELKADKSLLDAYATNNDLELKADLSLLDAYATNNDLELKADKSLLDAYAYLSLLDAYATSVDLDTHVNAINNPHEVTLNQAYDNGATRTITADDGAVIIDASAGNNDALELDGYLILDEISNPAPMSDAGMVYSKDVDGYSELNYMDNYGSAVQMTRRGFMYNLLPSYNVAQLPSASPAGQMIFVPDETGGAVPAFSDGANWRRVTDRNIVS
jgi:hypothetical protein